MKKAKIAKNNKKQKLEVEKDSYSIKKLLLIILVLVVIFGIFYLITTLFVNPIDESDISNGITEFDTTKITLNKLLSRKENEYYVLATKQRENNKTDYQIIYNNYINEYSSSDNSLKFYYVDLSDALNKNYIGEKTNITDELSKLKLNEDTLFKIKEGKIEEYFIGNSQIIKELSSLKES